MYKSEASFINGKFLYYAFIAGGNKVWNYLILLAHNHEGAQKAEERMRQTAVSNVDISPVIGMHA